MIRTPRPDHPRCGRRRPAVGLAGLLLMVCVPVVRADTLPTSPPAADLDLPVAPRFERRAAARPVAQQGQILFRHRSSVARLADDDLERALGSLAPGTRIRIAPPAGGSALTGAYRGLNLSTVQVETLCGPVAYERAEVQRLWVGRPQTGKGAVIGGVNGFLLGMLLGAVALDVRQPGDDPMMPGHGGFDPPPGRSDFEQFLQICFRWGLPGGLAGAALGGVIGSFTTGWQPVSP